MHNAEELSNVELIMKGIENAQSQQERDALWKMLQREMKEVSKEKKSEQKEKGKQSYVYPPYSLDTLMAQFGKKAQTSSKLTIESFHQEYTKEIKKIKSDIEVLYFALGAKENYSETESPKMPPLEKDDQDDQRKVGSMFINQHSNEVTGDNNISYIIRIPCIFAQDLKLTIHNFKALVDTGSRMNIINPCLVPARFREKCTSISGVNTSNGWSEVKWQVKIKIYITEQIWVQVISVLHPCQYGMLLGAPFLSMVMPHSYEKYHSKPDRYGVGFTLHGKSHLFKFIEKSEPDVINQIHAMESHLASISTSVAH